VFADSQTREVGGEVTGVEELREDGVYIVKRDINVRPGGLLFNSNASKASFFTFLTRLEVLCHCMK
jgi:hypothetical protein